MATFKRIRGWKELEQEIAAAHLPGDLDEAVEAVFPTRFWRSSNEPISPTAQRSFAWLWERAESLKRRLFHDANQGQTLLSLGNEEGNDIRGGIRLADLPNEIVGEQDRSTDFKEATAHVRIEEINRCIRAPLTEAVRLARTLAQEDKVDRIVLTGQSSWIPLLRRLLIRPCSEGGFGLAPNKIHFDAKNAKAAVSKGACLLRVMRDTLVGFDVDISDFKANLLGEIFYKSHSLTSWG